LIGVYALGETNLLVNEGKKSLRPEVVTTGWYKCVMILLDIPGTRLSIAWNFFICVNCEASGVGIPLRLKKEGFFSTSIK